MSEKVERMRWTPENLKRLQSCWDDARKTQDLSGALNRAGFTKKQFNNWRIRHKLVHPIFKTKGNFRKPHRLRFNQPHEWAQKIVDHIICPVAQSACAAVIWWDLTGYDGVNEDVEMLRKLMDTHTSAQIINVPVSAVRDGLMAVGYPNVNERLNSFFDGVQRDGYNSRGRKGLEARKNAEDSHTANNQ